MARDMLFRGFESTGIKRKWRFGSLVDVAMANAEESCYRIVEKLLDGIVYCPVVTESIGQFTGLTDKNGVEIFEGDIDSKGRVIVFNGCRFCIQLSRSETHIHTIPIGCDIEIIGNVFQNPELIGVQNEKTDK